MSRGLSILKRIPTILRTLRYLRPVQASAQLSHALFGLGTPVRCGGLPPIQAFPASATPFLPPPAHIGVSSKNQIEMLATSFELADRVDWTTTANGPLFAYHLHQQEYLRTDGFGPRDRVERILDWIARHRKGTGWDPHPISLRLLCWHKMLLMPAALQLNEESRALILASMADQAETLSRGLEIRLQANHLLSNLLAVVWSGVLLEGQGSEAWRNRAPMLIDELDRQIHPDGGHEERSPMYHSLILENILDLLNLCRVEPNRAPVGLIEALEAAIRRMVPALGLLTHPDGEIALFADSAFDIASKPDMLVDYANRLGVESADSSSDEGSEALGVASQGSRLLPQTGYLRLESSKAVLIASTSGPAPAHQPGHAHCDALAFELSLAGKRIITDTGLFEYRLGARRDRARATAAHSTLQIDSQEQAEIWSAHRVGGRPVVELVAWDGESQAEATCRGWSSTSTTHRRTFRIDEGCVTIIDEIEGPSRNVSFCLPIAPEWRIELDLVASRASAIQLETAETSVQEPLCVDFDLPSELKWRVERGPYYPSFGREIERDLLIGEAVGFASSTLRIHLRGS